MFLSGMLEFAGKSFCRRAWLLSVLSAVAERILGRGVWPFICRFVRQGGVICGRQPACPPGAGEGRIRRAVYSATSFFERLRVLIVR